MVRRVTLIAVGSGLCVALGFGVGIRATAAQSVLPTSDRAAGYIVFPKVVVDLNDQFCDPAGSCPQKKVDTFIQLTNTGYDRRDDPTADPEDNRVIECFYVDATSRCNNSNPPAPCRTSADCGSSGVCLPRWSQTNFTIALTPEQPAGWLASTGTNLDNFHGGGVVPPLADPSASPVYPYFIGELKCVQVDGTTVQATTTTPIDANELKGEATIYEVASGDSGHVDARSYNAIGFQTQGAPNSDQVLCLGASPNSSECATAEYASCPAILVVNHFFDDAPNPVSGAPIRSDLTLVPCTEDLREGPGGTPSANQLAVTAQILVFNEFEQRLSSSVRLACFKEIRLSNIDQTAGNEASSIFNVNVQGTLAGQTRLRPVLTSDNENGSGLLGLIEEFHGSFSTAYNVNYVGINEAKGDMVRYSVSTGQ